MLVAVVTKGFLITETLLCNDCWKKVKWSEIISYHLSSIIHRCYPENRLWSVWNPVQTRTVPYRHKMYLCTRTPAGCVMTKHIRWNSYHDLMTEQAGAELSHVQLSNYGINLASALVFFFTYCKTKAYLKILSQSSCQEKIPPRRNCPHLSPISYRVHENNIAIQGLNTTWNIIFIENWYHQLSFRDNVQNEVLWITLLFGWGTFLFFLTTLTSNMAEMQDFKRGFTQKWKCGFPR